LDKRIYRSIEGKKVKPRGLFVHRGVTRAEDDCERV
jgi:hypothetical protein